ncbi:MAG: NAD(P)/FAD-dependent oxidoreductase [Clostridiaceae bacterium]|nr:NAD(P)/FAD-dependent oxidoreductase [Clostridiaceae bacterium]
MSRRTIVIGAGAAGLMAAGRAAERGFEVILLEKNDRPGKKLRISGKGRCNITNNTDIDGLIQNIPGNGSFLYSSFYTFSNEDIMQFFRDEGLELKVERGGRVFPVSDDANDVVSALVRRAARSGAVIRYRSPVTSIEVSDGAVKGVALKNSETIECDSVVLATGGVSYPGTGSTGDGYKMAQKLGHTIAPLKPSLVPLVSTEKWVKDLQGLTLKNIAITIYDRNRKKVYTDFGEMLFTHFGVSGPVILSASRHIIQYGYRDVFLSIDLKPALSPEILDSRIQRDFEKYSRKQFKNSLDDLLPQKMIPVIVDLSGISADKPVNQVTKTERRTLVSLLKGLTLEISGSRPISEAIVTAGGICTDEIDPATMESKLIKGLFFAGEIMDVDGYTGGFNLTIAFSTGYVAGMYC